MAKLIAQFVRNDSGATAIEYGVMATMIAVACVAAFLTLGGAVNGLFGSVNDKAGSVLTGG
ncbi:MAG: Flp family type IVb pilin [Devosia sp.]